MLIERDLIALRAPIDSDIDALFTWEHDLQGQGDDATPPSRFEIWQYIRNYVSDPLGSGEQRLIVSEKVTNQPIGYVDLYSIERKTAGVGIYIEPAWRCKGVGSTALSLLVNYAKNLGLQSLWAHIASDNISSERTFTNAGFQQSQPGDKFKVWLNKFA